MGSAATSIKGTGMNPSEYVKKAGSVQTASGQIGYVERGTGPAALFVHGILMNSWLWRNQLDDLSDMRRCIAVDIMGHGRTEIAPGQDVSVTAQARMLAEFLDAIRIDRVDLVGNDTGGAICQIFAALYPERVRSITLTNCETHDNWPPAAFMPFIEMVKGGELRATLDAMLNDTSIYRSPQGFGACYEHPEHVADDTIDTYLRPLVRSAQRTHDVERFVAAMDNKHTVAIESGLRALRTRALIAWATDDVFFQLKWAQWLESTLQGATRLVEFEGARIFFPEERPKQFNRELARFWR
jgi:pimeloyl-ACP methyl ester carboxylesterase